MKVRQKSSCQWNTGRLLSAVVMCLVVFTCQACSSQSPEINPPPFNVGFSIYDFDYTGPEGEKEVLTAAVWYPTTVESESFTYNNGFTSSITHNGPVNEEHAPYPLIIFNHGMYSSGIEYLPLTEYLASEGFIVVAPDYDDTMAPDFVTQAALSRIRNQEEVSDPIEVAKALDDFDELLNTTRKAIVSYMEKFRLQKAIFIVDAMLAINEDTSSPFYSLIDGSAIGMAGHSLGGLTTLGLIGAYKEVDINDKRIKAALIMSAPDPFQENIDGVDIPIMIMHGDIDAPSLVPLAESLYEKADAAKFYMVIRFATHVTFSNAPCANHDSISQCQREDEHIRLINSYAVAFFNRYLKHDMEAKEELWNSNTMLAKYNREF